MYLFGEAATICCNKASIAPLGELACNVARYFTSKVYKTYISSFPISTVNLFIILKYISHNLNS